MVMVEEAKEESVEESQQIKCPFGVYPDRGVGSMGNGE
jgi:hypothetical protein